MFDIDDEFRGDFKFTSEAYAKRCMMMASPRKENSEHYGI
jgi:hypothetical protein